MENLTFATIIGNLLGALLKHKTALASRLIPFVLFAATALKNLLITLEALPAEWSQTALLASAVGGDVPGTIAHAAFIPGSIALFLAQSFFDTTAPIGAHSIAKNLLQYLRDRKKKRSRARRPRKVAARKKR